MLGFAFAVDCRVSILWPGAHVQTPRERRALHLGFRVGVYGLEFRVSGFGD